MKNTCRKFSKGITLIELMIVLVIVAILLGLAYPSYVDYVRKSKRGDAQQALMNWSVNQEIWRSNHPTYASTTDMPAADLDYYSLNTTGTLDGDEYTLQAAAKAGNDQNNDKAKDGSSCATMTLDQNGVKSPAACWD
ncbi:MAG: prepilin-type N-terminal cleavage/methylation domain-containing protein [Gammaproteobacteria bacterium]|nr:prepilin-type N-terminal cleavage/methylation domain-containing protein [Gammaproteobacteria bacterium]NNJ78630.1 prepilin-type N-terminal cleavage/methylation domain-containing protein [Xanthomonadales bacterium]